MFLEQLGCVMQALLSPPGSQSQLRRLVQSQHGHLHQLRQVNAQLTVRDHNLLISFNHATRSEHIGVVTAVVTAAYSAKQCNSINDCNCK